MSAKGILTGQPTATSIGSTKRSLSPQAGPVLGWMLSAFVVVVSLTLSTPKTDDLVEVSGHIRTSVELAGGRTQRRGVIFTLDDRPDRYWTGALTEHQASGRARSIPGSFVRTYVEKTSSLPKAYGAAQSIWGLSIDGETVESLKDALDTDRARKHVLLPSIALVLALVSFMGFRYAPQAAVPGCA